MSYVIKDLRINPEEPFLEVVQTMAEQINVKWIDGEQIIAERIIEFEEKDFRTNLFLEDFNSLVDDEHFLKNTNGIVTY